MTHRPFTLIPVSPMRFRIDGAPAGFALELELLDGTGKLDEAGTNRSPAEPPATWAPALEPERQAPDRPTGRRRRSWRGWGA